ncbi:hypothetical protein DL98DRAFT_583267 [Cadophora sp. DSE1049]|nr:hypothetical protein DL98DRAFT_583267 [Cadophora sp. DSE1049]
MVKLQDLIRNGKVRGPAARGLVRDISLNNVTDAQSEIRTQHRIDGKTHRYTVLTLTLDGSELLVTDQAKTEPQFKDASTSTTPPPQSMNGRHNMSAQIPDHEIAAFKKKLEKKANKALQKQLNEHNEAHKKRAEKSLHNYDKLLNKTLNIVRAKGDDLQNGHLELRVPDTLAAKILANSPKIFAEYQKACEESLKEYRAELKRQYRQHLNDIELECRNWMKANKGSNLKIGALDGLTNTITQATNFVAPLPIIDKSVSDRFTEDILAADMEDNIAEFKELASKPVEDGGLSFCRKSVKLEPLFDDSSEPDDGGNASMVGVPAALLPMYQSTSRPSNNQASATLSVIDRNNSSRAGQPTSAPVFGTSGPQVQGVATQNHFVNQFTPINRPYVSPYPVLPARQSAPVLVPSSNWYGSTERLLADRSRPSPPENNAIPGTQDSAVAFSSQIPTGGGGSVETSPEYPPYPLPFKRVFKLPSTSQQLSVGPNKTPSIQGPATADIPEAQISVGGGFAPKTTYPSNPLPRAGVFKLPTVTQQTPRRVAPTLIAPVQQLEGSLNNEDDETLNISRPASAISRSNIVSALRRSDSTIEYSSSFVDASLYDADYDEEEVEDYVPPPVVPDRQQQQQTCQSTGNRSAHPQPSRIDPNTYVDESLYDEDYVPPPALATPRQSQPGHYIKTEPHETQPIRRMTSLRSHTPPTPPSPFLNDTQGIQFDNRYGDLPEYERSRGEADELPSYQDFDEEEAETSRYLSRAPVQRAGNRDAISISSDDDEDGDADEEDEDDYNPEQHFEDGNAYRKNDDPHGPISNYYAPEPSFGVHIDPHASERDARPRFSQNERQNQQTGLKRKREDSPLPVYYPSSENVERRQSGENFGFQQRFRGKTVSQVMQMLKIEEARKDKRSAGSEGVGDGYEDGGAGDRAAKRVWYGVGEEL